MKKVFLFAVTAVFVLSAMTGCSGNENVSNDKDGKITEPSSLIEEATDMISEIMTEPTTQRSTTEPTTERTTTESVGGETQEATESTSEEDNARSRRIMPR